MGRFTQFSGRKHAQSGVPADVDKLREDIRIAQANYRALVIAERHCKAAEAEIDIQTEYRLAAAQAVEELRNNWRDA
jgi:hypothetical protein